MYWFIIGPFTNLPSNCFFHHLFWLSGRDGQIQSKEPLRFTPIWATKPLQLHVEVVSKPEPELRTERFIGLSKTWTSPCLVWDEHVPDTINIFDFGYKKKETFVWNRDMTCDMFGKTWGIYQAVHLQILRWMVWYQWCVLTHALQCHITTNTY